MSKVNEYHPVWNELSEKFNHEQCIRYFTSCYLFEKDGNFQHIIHFLKYEGIKSVGVRFGKEIGKRILSDSLLSFANYLVPVPLHSLKKRERGYNQSEYLCRGISEVTSIPVYASFIKRSRYTQSQTTLNIQERKENVSDAFIIPEKLQLLVEGKSFILVDDVITTGATINACARLLKGHGAASVFAASAALAE